MKNKLVGIFFILCACAFGLYASLYVPSYLQEKNRRQTHWAVSMRKIAPEADLAEKAVKRLDKKSSDIERLGITGKERDRLIDQEFKAVEVEKERVRKSGYKLPFEEKPLVIRPQ